MSDALPASACPGAFGPPRRERANSASRPLVPELVLLAFFLLTFGVLDPQLKVTNFSELTVPSAVADLSTANPYNQLRWLVLLLVALIPVLTNPRRIMRASLQAWPVGLLLGLCILSALWSDYPDVTLRRALGLLIPAFCLLVGVTYVDNVWRGLFIVYLAFWVALLANLACLPFAFATDERGFFRGIAGEKNTLGGLAALALLFGSFGRMWRPGLLSRAAFAGYFFAWAFILVMTVSKTSIALAFLTPVVFFLAAALSRLLRVSFSSAGLAAAAFASVALGIAHYGFGVTPADLLGTLAADTTFTGRTPIWAFMLDLIGDHWLVGIGFGSIWGVGYNAPNLRSIYDYIQLLNQAHNGYLDVLAALGVLGLALLALAFLNFAAVAERLRGSDTALFRLLWILVLFSLLHNLMESSFLIPFNFIWHMTLLAIFTAGRAVAEGGRPWSR